MKSLLSSALTAIQNYIEKNHSGNVASAARDLDISIPTLHSWLNGTRIPSFSKMAPLLEKIGAYIVSQDETGPYKEVCFVDAKVVPAGENLPPPPDEDYLAVPLVDEVGAGPGIIPQNELISWFLVWRYQKAVQHKRDLIAVMVGKHSTSMVPTLKPQDIVLVDREDKDVTNFKGRIMLVMDPFDGSGKIKRVATENLPKKKDVRITYYSDNAAENPPEVYSLMEDFEGDWHKAIVGRVVWAWSDVSNK